MKRMLIISSLLALLTAACATQVDYVANSSGKSPRPDNCDIEVYLPGTSIARSYDIIGSVLIGDSGLTMSCGQATVIKQAKEKGCQVGADAILLTEIKEPDWISTCYRIKGNMLVYRTQPAPPVAAAPIVEPTRSGPTKSKPDGHRIAPPPPFQSDKDSEEPITFEPIPFE